VSSPVEGWAVLAAKDDYSDVGMTDLLVDYIDIARMRDALENLGWNPDQIHDLKDFDRQSLQSELDWLEENADENDLVLLYVTSHGEYLRRVVGWEDFVPKEWEQILSQRRVLIVDSCQAAKFTATVRRDPHPQLTIAAVDQDELGWKGLEEEGLPIIGGVFTFYFVEALENPLADTDHDGLISVQEAAALAEERQQDYMHEVVFEVEEFLEMYYEIGFEPEQDPTFPDVILKDTIKEPLFLDLNPE
jgi:hypothetical protein